MELVDQYEAIVNQLKALSKELRIRNPAKLLQAARGRIPGANTQLAQIALEDSASRQTLAPKFRSTGRSMAEAPDSRIQADLIDFSQNTRNTKEKFALMIQDVYTREVRAQPLLNKQPATVNAAMRSLMPTLVGDKQIMESVLIKAKNSHNSKREGYRLRQCTARNKVLMILVYWTAACRLSRLTWPKFAPTVMPQRGPARFHLL